MSRICAQNDDCKKTSAFARKPPEKPSTGLLRAVLLLAEAVRRVPAGGSGDRLARDSFELAQHARRLHEPAGTVGLRRVTDENR